METIKLFAKRWKAFRRGNKAMPSHRCILPRTIDTTTRYVGNTVRTHKYTPITFLPLNLYEQFHRLANLYFVAIILLNFVPAFESFSRAVSAIPLASIMLLTAVKDAIEDFRRWLSDRKLNAQTCLVYDVASDSYKQCAWRDVKVGDFVRLECDHVIPADILLLHSSDRHNLCYVETSNLDGETNLKHRAAVLEQEHRPPNFRFALHCEQPNNHIYSFHGYLESLDDKTRIAVGKDHILLRGCVVRNVDLAEGLVVYAGHETKAMLNSTGVHYKRTTLERLTNWDILWCALVLLCLCFIGAVAHGHWMSQFEFAGDQIPFLPHRDTNSSSALEQFVVFWSFIIVFQVIVPIALYITVDLVKMAHAYLLAQDSDLYYERKDRPLVCRSLNLSEELGQIQYVLSDKTGTLTENRMVFRRCTITGRDFRAETELADTFTTNTELLNYLVAKAGPLANEARLPSNPAIVLHFMLNLTICNTVVIAHNQTLSGPMRYEGESIDELALVKAAQAYNIELSGREPNQAIVTLPDGRALACPILHVLPFDSVRKCMSVIVRNPLDHDQFLMYTKGADSSIFQLISESYLGNTKLRRHFERAVENVLIYSRLGLRTLCHAMRILSPSEYTDWLLQHRQAEQAIDNRDALLFQSAIAIERDLTLLGVTAIEDRLQDGVSDCIASLQEAAIRVWLITGDKLETAINIAYACQLFCNRPERANLMKLTVNDADDAQSAMSAYLVATQTNAVLHYLVLDGVSLHVCLSDDLLLTMLVELVERCDAAVFCRVTPLQKASIARIAKHRLKVRTLAVGDGANDVSMIQEADVGIGISGQEGMQAVLASDYAMGQFRFLQRLLLVHGHWNYVRITNLILYILYSNAIYVFSLFWYQLNCGFSAQLPMDPLYLMFYQVLFVSLPPIIYAVFEQDAAADLLETRPELYEVGRNNTLYRTRSFWSHLFDAFWQSLALSLVIQYAFKNSSTGLWEYGTTVMFCVIAVNQVTILTTAYSLNPLLVIVSVGSLLFFTFFALAYNAVAVECCGWNPPFYVTQRLLATPLFWLTSLLAVTCATLPRIALLALHQTVWPNCVLRERRREKLRRRKAKTAVKT